MVFIGLANRREQRSPRGRALGPPLGPELEVQIGNGGGQAGFILQGPGTRPLLRIKTRRI